MIRCYLCKNGENKPQVYHVVHNQCVSYLMYFDRQILDKSIPNGENICTKCLKTCRTSITKSIRCSICLSLYTPLYPGSTSQGEGCDITFSPSDKVGSFDRGGYGSKYDDRKILLGVDIGSIPYKDRANPILFCDSCIDTLVRNNMIVIE